MFRLQNNLPAALLLAVLCGCAHVEDTRSLAHKQAAAWALQGERAYFSGDLEQARRSYERALQVNLSIENAHGIASDALSLAQIHIDRGEYEQAAKRLRGILDDRNHLFSPEDKAGAAARSARLALVLKQPDSAAESARQAEAWCKETDCALGASILNLQAQAAVALGNPDGGLDAAKRAESLADKLKQPVEQANACRLQGAILLRRQAAADAAQQFERALALDKQQGQAGKIAEDLHGLAEVAGMQGRHAEAESLREREQAVRKALGEGMR